MRSVFTRTVVAAVAAALVALGTAGSAAAHGGATLAEGGADGVRILLQGTDATTSSGAAAVDLSTVVRGPGTDGAVVTYWIRPAGGETFRKTTVRDDTGVAHTDVPTADRGDWRQWDVSAVVQLDDGTRLRVSNAEANPPGPDPASTPGGGAKGPDEDSGEGTTTATTPTETTPEAVTTGATPTETTPTETAPTTATDDDSAPVSDVTGEDDGTPGWVLPSLIAVVVIALAWVVFFRRPRSGDDRDDDQGPSSGADPQ